MLQPLVPSIARGRPPASRDADRCGFCGTTDERRDDGACVPCQLVLNLDRPHIDDEAVLGWVPEISQAALNRIVRELHCRLHESAGRSGNERGPHYVTRALNERVGAAAKILGTSQPSELAQSLDLLPQTAYAERHRLLGGIRVMPAGRFFVDGADAYPQILAEWCRARADHGAQT